MALAFIYSPTFNKTGFGNQSGLDSFLFGKAAALLLQDVWIMASLAGIVCLGVILFFRSFVLLSFNKAYGESMGLPMQWIEQILLLLGLLTIILGIQAVGIVLMVALLITPAAAARFWTSRLSWVFGIAMCFGASASLTGAYLSYIDTQMPTGPWIVVVLSSFALISFFFAPHRGWVAKKWQMMQQQRRMTYENALKGLYGKADQPNNPHSVADMQHNWAQGWRLSTLQRVLKRLQKEKAAQHSPKGWQLLPKGVQLAQVVINRHRLWETYLQSQLDIPADQVHAEAERMEHILDQGLDEKLHLLMGKPKRDPHNRKIFDTKK